MTFRKKHSRSHKVPVGGRSGQAAGPDEARTDGDSRLVVLLLSWPRIPYSCPAAETDSNPESVLQLITSMIQEDFLYVLACSIHLLSFESRKDSQAIFSYVLRFRPPGSTAEDSPALSYVINDRPEVVIELCRGYNNKESAMPCGAVLREVLKHELIVSIILYDQSLEDQLDTKIDEIAYLDVPQSGDGVFWKFFDWIDGGAFEVSADAFTTFRVSTVASHGRTAWLTLYDLGHSDQTQAPSVPVPNDQL